MRRVLRMPIFTLIASVALMNGPAWGQAASTGTPKNHAAPIVTAIVQGDRSGAVVDRRIFSQFAEHLGAGIYGGIWVGPESDIPNIHGYRSDVVAALKDLQVPVVRWPGGCFADEYHWREGIGPRKDRPVKVNTNWGGVTENNAFGTHEFMEFAELIGAQAYVSGNVGSGTPQEMAEWVEYMTAAEGSLADLRARNGRKAPWKLPFFGIGNELWGCGGSMKAEYAADLTRRYGEFIKAPVDNRPAKMASGANGDDYNWTRVMMREATKKFDGIGLHYYTVPTGSWDGPKGSATQFTREEYARTIARTLKMDVLIAKHSAIMDEYDPKRRVNLAVDEWGTWYDVEPGTNPGFLYQQNTMRDAIVAALNINIFSRHAERVRMTNIAQMVNVLQAMILTDGPRMVLTPTYHVFHMYRPFQDATFLPVTLKTGRYKQDQWSTPMVDASAVRAKDGKVYMALVNVDPDRPATVSTSLRGMAVSRVSGSILRADRVEAHNSFDAPENVKPLPFDGAALDRNMLTATLPAGSVVMLRLE